MQDEPAAPEAGDMDEWVELHEAVDRLPIEEREVVGLIFYHGWKQEQIAALLKISARTVRRRWESACRKIRRLAKFDCEQPNGENG
jgi:RNA polymerase sigma factor (sigma-70 family)